MAIDIGPKISLGGEKQFRDQMKAVNSQIKASASEAKALASAYDKTDRSTEGLISRQKALKDQQKALQDQLSGSQQKVKLLTEEYNRQSDKLKTLESAMEQARKENGEGSEEAAKAENAYAKQAAAVNNLESQISSTTGEIYRINDELKQNAIQLAEAESKAIKYGEAMEKAGSKITAVGDGMSKAGNALTIGVTAPLLAVGTAALNYASDVVESENKVDESFKGASQVVKDFAETTVESYGISKGVALDMAALYGDMGTSMGLSEEAAADMSTTLVGLAGDIASFKNIDLETAANALQGIFTGETKSLKSLGVVMTETNLKAWAMEQGLLATTKSEEELEKQSLALEKAQKAYNTAVEKHGEGSLEAREAMAKLTKAEEEFNSEASISWDNISQSEKIMIRYKYVLDQTANAHGDYLRTSDGMANSMRTMQESAKELAADFGQELLPVVIPIIQDGIKLVKVFKDLDASEKQMIIRTAGIAAAAGPALKIGGTAISGIGKITTGVGGLVKDMGKLQAVKAGAEAVGELGSKAVMSAEGVSGLSKVLTLIGPAIGPVAVVLGVATAAVVGLYAAWDKHTKSLREAREEAAKSKEQFHALASSMQEAEQQTAANISAADQEADRLNKLWNELQNLVDADGNILEKDHERVEYITGELNEALGTQLTLEGNTLVNYNEQAAAIDKLIAKKRAQMQLNAGDAKYQAALSARDEGQEAQIQLMADIAAKQAKVAELKAAMEETLANGGSILNSDQYVNELIALRELERQYQENAGVIGQANLEIENYQKAHEEFEQGHYEQVEEYLNRQVLAYTAAGGATREALGKQAQDLTNYYKLMQQDLANGVSGVTEGMVQEAKKAAEQATVEFQLAGGAVGEGYVVGFNEATGQPIYDAIAGMSGRLKSATHRSGQQIKAVLENFGGEIGWALPLALRDASPEVQQATIELFAKAREGAYLSENELKEVFANIGLNLPQELMGQLNRQAPELFTETVSLLKELESASEKEKPSIRQKLKMLGILMDDSIEEGLEANKSDPINKGKEINKAVGKEVGKAVSGPSVSSAATVSSALAAAQSARASIQNYFENHPVSVRGKVSVNVDDYGNVAFSRYPHYATGGIVSQPTMAIVGEEAPEAIIPLSESRRSRALDLLDETARMLGVESMNYVMAAGRSMGAGRNQANTTAAGRDSSVIIEEGAIRFEVNTAATDADEVARKVEKSLEESVRKYIRVRR